MDMMQSLILDCQSGLRLILQTFDSLLLEHIQTVLSSLTSGVLCWDNFSFCYPDKEEEIIWMYLEKLTQIWWTSTHLHESGYVLGTGLFS